MANENSILLIDALNLFSRHYVRNPAMSTQGHQAGGIVGFLTTLGYLVGLLAPKNVYIVWEGGGSTRRRAIFPEYKLNRRPPKLNRYYEDDIPDSSENRLHQIRFLVDVLKNVPVCQLFIDDCEADDVIGYLSRNKLKDKKKVIVSSDRDLYQLLDDSTMIYSLTTKTFLGSKEIIEKFGISPANFVLAKAMAGDPSDGIPGVKGVGFKTLAKRFVLSGPEPYTVDGILQECESKIGKKSPKIYSHIYNSSDIIKRNWKLMYLDVSNLAAMQIRKIEAIIDNYEPTMNRMQMMKLLIDEGLGTFDTLDFFASFASL